MKPVHLALCASAFVFGSAAHAGSLYPNKVIDIDFDPYCDGMHLTINHTTGLVTGYATGCISDPVAGVAGSMSKTGAGVVVLKGSLIYLIDDSGKTWVIYDSSGNVINSGTYIVGVPVAPQGLNANSKPSAGR